MKRFIILTSVVASIFAVSCGGGDSGNSGAQNTATGEEPKSMVASAEQYDPKRGEGKYTAENLKLEATIDEAASAKGEAACGVKCASCHKYTEEKLVGPGWKGVTIRRTPEWVMNFITNPDPMLDKDPEAQAMLELCLVRMPNQNLNDDEARQILEFMRKNDSSK